MDQRSTKSYKEIAKQLISEIFYFLETSYYYTPTISIEDSHLFVESINVEFTNEIRRRNVWISYTQGEVDGELRFTFSAAITRIPYAGNEDFFSLSNFLVSKDKNYSTSLINDFDSGDAEMILKKTARSLKEDALPIIAGEVWFEQFYPKKD